MMCLTVSPGTRIGRAALLAAALLPALPAAAAADLPRRIEIATVPVAEPSFVTRVVAPNASCLAVSDVAGVLAVGFRYGGPAEVRIHALDAAGTVVEGDPVTIPLPMPKSLQSLKAASVCTVALAFHPTLPLLYVWQDTNAAGQPAKADAKLVFSDFDHLLVVSLAAAAPRVVATVGCGPEYAHNRSTGELVVSPAAGRLFLPNLRMPGGTSSVPALGYMEIDAAGMPRMVQGKPALVLEDVSVMLAHPNGYGMVPVSDDIWIFPGSYGPATLDRTNRRGRITGVTYPGNACNWYHTAHPTLPVVYTTARDQSTIYRIEHAGGFPSNIYQSINVAAGQPTTPPVVMAKRKAIAWGSNERVVIVGIDAAGGFTTQAAQVPVKNRSVGRLAWSQKSARLYVPVEAE
jgi:hypothetical protein